jgi:hypothetical protein
VAWVEKSLIDTIPAIKNSLFASDIVLNIPHFFVYDMEKKALNFKKCKIALSLATV